MSVFDWVSGRVFKFVHGNNLVYNTCWEDPRLDRVALELGPSETVLVITSAGCNALDYALCGPQHVYAVDMNPRQNALLDLKIAGIKTLPFEDFFRLFGYGFHPDARGKTPTEARKAPVRPVAGAPADAKHPEVLAVPVACVGKVPNLVARFIKGQIKGGSPVVPVWIDFGDQMKSQFPFAAGVPNVVVLDVHGRYRYASSGLPTTEGTNRLLGVIEALRKEAVQGR